MSNFYSKEIEEITKYFYSHLNEKDRRHCAALLTLQLPFGGREYISSLLNIDTRTIHEGKVELENAKIVVGGIRKEGGGRKNIYAEYSNLDAVFLSILKESTAGDPMNENIIWTDLTKNEIIQLLHSKEINVSKEIVSQLLKKHGYVKRKIQKKRK